MEPEAFTTITFNSTEASNRNTIKEEWSWDLSENRRAGSLWASKPLTKECPHFRVKLEVPAPYICIGILKSEHITQMGSMYASLFSQGYIACHEGGSQIPKVPPKLVPNTVVDVYLDFANQRIFYWVDEKFLNYLDFHQRGLKEGCFHACVGELSPESVISFVTTATGPLQLPVLRPLPPPDPELLENLYQQFVNNGEIPWKQDVEVLETRFRSQKDEEVISRFSAIPTHMYDMMIKMYSTNPKSHEGAATTLDSILYEIKNQDSEFDEKLLPQYIRMLSVMLEKPQGLTGQKWMMIAEHIINVFGNILDKNSGSFSDMASVLFKTSEVPRLRMRAGGVLFSFTQQNPRSLVPFVQQLIEISKVENSLLGPLWQVYKFKQEPFENQMDMFIQRYLKGDIGVRSSLGQFFNEVAGKNPALLRPLCKEPKFKETLFTMIGGMSCIVASQVSASFPEDFYDWLPEIQDGFNAQVDLSFWLFNMLGFIGCSSAEKAKEVLPILIKQFKVKATAPSAITAISSVKNIQAKYKQEVQPYIEEIRPFTTSSVTGVADAAKGIIAVAEEKDLESISKQVGQNTQEISQVKAQVDEQEKRIENVEEAAVEAHQRIEENENNLVKVAREVVKVSDKVDQVDEKTEENRKQIRAILDQFDEMNAKVHDACKNYDDLKKYIDDNTEMLKEFVSQFAKKLPTPYNFTSEGYIRRTMTLYFECSVQGTTCLYTRAHPYKTVTNDWAKWLKLGFSLYKLGMAVYDKSVLDVYETVKELYGLYTSSEDQDFVSFISEPFLTSAEQDSLLNQLRDQRFFDLFEYQPQTALWCCARCAKMEADQKKQLEDAKNQAEQDAENKRMEEEKQKEEKKQKLIEEAKEKSNNQNNNAAVSLPAPKEDSPLIGETMIAIFSYKSQRLTFSTGDVDIDVALDDIVTVLADFGNEWLFIERNGQKGLVPRDKLKKHTPVVIQPAPVTPVPASNSSSPPPSNRPSRVSSFLKIDVGLFGRVKRVWCVFENNHMVIYKSDNPQHLQKPKKDIQFSEIVKIEDIIIAPKKQGFFSVVTSEEIDHEDKIPNTFALVTTTKTYKVEAENPVDFQLWKSVLIP